MTVYYNDNDPRSAAWLRELVDHGCIAPGEVDERDIWDVQPADLAGFVQCHFFAGIGGWSYALRLAGWPDDRPVWTGSCPCQPFSQAGKGIGFADPRHLWPAWFHLIRQCRPVTIFGEQVASRGGLAWLDLISADLGGEGYACGAVDTCAAGFGAPHLRKRLYWVGDSELLRRHKTHPGNARSEGPSWLGSVAAGSGRAASALGDSAGDDQRRMPDDTFRQGLPDRGPGSAGGAWADADWLPCQDGKARPIEPGVFPLAYGIPGRVGRLRGYGNAVVPPQAAAFIMAYMDLPRVAARAR